MANKIGELDSELKEKDILDVIKTLKNNKSKFGPVSNEMLKCNPKAIIRTLCSLFNYVLKSKHDIFPEIWNLSLLNPIHKSGTQYCMNTIEVFVFQIISRNSSPLCSVIDSSHGFHKRVLYLTNL